MKGKINKVVRGEGKHPSVVYFTSPKGAELQAKTWSKTLVSEAEKMKGREVSFSVEEKEVEWKGKKYKNFFLTEINGVKPRSKKKAEKQEKQEKTVRQIDMETKETIEDYKAIAEDTLNFTFELISKYSDKFKALKIDRTEAFRVIFGTVVIQANKTKMVNDYKRW